MSLKMATKGSVQQTKRHLFPPAVFSSPLAGLIALLARGSFSREERQEKGTSDTSIWWFPDSLATHSPQSVARSVRPLVSPVTAITNYHKPGDLKQQKFILSQIGG